MLSINNLSYYLGDRALYEDAALHIKPKDKIGLIGLNGTGKSTLLRLIVGEYQPDIGSIEKSKDCTIGFLNQDLLSFESDESILSVVMTAFAETLKIQHQIDQVLQKMETDYTDDLVDKLTKLQERFEALEGYSLQSKAEEILEGVGFSTEDLKKPLREFSGGWRMRVMLAKLLLEKPSLLLLDEPTNHLDLPSIQWIETYLKTYEGAVVVVSHDKYFLDNSVTSIVDVSGRKLNLYAGNYSFYLSERELRHEIQKNAFENQQQKIKQTEQFIERFRSKATKARQVQSKIKSLDRMEVVEDIVDENAAVNFKFSFSQKSGRHVVMLSDIHKSYGDLQIIDKGDGVIERGDKIALIGANGKGKSTLLRIIADTEPFEGKRQVGHNVVEGFFAQHQLESLTLENDLLEELKQAGTNKTETELRSVLGCFLFSGDDVFKKIKVLSGGEKSRVALAKTLISQSNFLLLDEPTNHLDIQSVNILIQALKQYEGTFIVVSHDRHFVSNVANKIWYIDNHEIKIYPGTYDEFVWWQKQHQKSVENQPLKVKQTKQKDAKRPPRNDAEDKEVQKALKKLKNELNELEQAIEKGDKLKADLEAQLADKEVYSNADRLTEVNTSYDKNQVMLDNLNEKWEEIALKIEEMED